MYYVAEKSRDGSRRIYHKGKRIAYPDRRLQDGYKTLAAAKRIVDKLSTDIALDIYSHRALEGERYYEENYKEYEIENTKERALQMSVREFLNCCNSCIAILFLTHAVNAFYTHSSCNLAKSFACILTVKLH